MNINKIKTCPWWGPNAQPWNLESWKVMGSLSTKAGCLFLHFNYVIITTLQLKNKSTLWTGVARTEWGVGGWTPLPLEFLILYVSTYKIKYMHQNESWPPPPPISEKEKFIQDLPLLLCFLWL